MSKSNTDAAKSRTAVGKPGAGTGSAARADRSRTTDGITITRWNLGLSLTIALTVVAGAFTLVWDEIAGLRDTQVELVSRVSGLEVQVRDLREGMNDLREEVRDLREEMSDLREEVRRDINDLREELRADIQELADLIRARETPGAGAE